MGGGIPVHGEVVSADAHAGVAFTLSKGALAFTLGTDDTLFISDLQVVMEDAGAFAVVADSDAAGKRVAKGSVLGGGGVVLNFQTPFECPRGIMPKLIADAGNVSALIQGLIQRA